MQGTEGWLGQVAGLLVVVLVLAAAISDVRWRRVPNWQTMPGLAVGLLLSTIDRGADGLVSSMVGAAFCLCLGVIPFTMGLMGGGDVKLQMAIGSLVGWPVVLPAFAYGAIAGGVLALGLIIYQRSLLHALRYGLCAFIRLGWGWLGPLLPARAQAALAGYQVPPPPALKAKLPYALAIGTGALIALYAQYSPVPFWSL